ncbi:MAG: flagellar hook assembly protein FlgD [Bryobacteraceae bacterium]
MASGINSLTSSSSASSSSSSSSSSAPTEQMFLQLLVAQLQNQDPLNPTDSTQFVSQLAQFSELEQVMGIRSDIETYHSQAEAAASAASSDSSSTTNGSNSTAAS